MISVMAAAVASVLPTLMAMTSPIRVHGPRQAPRDYGKRTSRYMPHQGKQECARRVRQMAQLGIVPAGKTIEVVK